MGGIAANGDQGSWLINVTWDHTSVSAKWHLIPSNGFSRVHECDSRHTYRRTDNVTMCRSRRNHFQGCRLI